MTILDALVLGTTYGETKGVHASVLFFGEVFEVTMYDTGNNISSERRLSRETTRESTLDSGRLKLRHVQRVELK